jgi:hypothetical protein
LLAASHAGVIALGNDVGQPVVDCDLDLDIGILAQKFREFRPKDRVGRVVDGVDPDGAGRLLPKLTEGRKLGVDFLEARAQGVKQAFARLRRRDAARGAGQESNSQPGSSPLTV